MTNFFSWFQRYGLIIVLLNAWGLLFPDLSPKTALSDLDLNLVLVSRSGSNAFKQISWILPFFFYVFSLIKDGVSFRVSQGKLALVFGFSALVALCFLSVIWSDFPAFTLKRVVFQAVFISSIVFGVFYAIKFSTLVACINVLFYTVLLVCTIAIISGNGVQGGAFLAWANSKNNFGAYMLSLIALFCMSRYYYEIKPVGLLVKLVILFLLLVASVSKTSIAIGVLLLFSGFIPYVLSKLFFASLMALFSILFILLPLVSSWLGMYWDISYAIEPETLTGRGKIWDSVYYGLKNYGSLLTGHGYGAYFGTGEIPYALDDSWSFVRLLSSAHNGYIGLFLQLGGILSLFVMFILYKLVCYTQSSVCFLVAAIVLIHNVTESSFVRDQHVIWALLVLLICIGIFSREREINESVVESES